MTEISDNSDLDGDLLGITPDSDCDKDSPNLKEVCSIFEPYLQQRNERCIKELKDRLFSIGAVTLSHLKHIIEKDLEGLVKAADFRACMSKVARDQEAPRPSNSASGMYCLNLKSLVSSTFYERLQTDQEILTKQDRSKLIVAVADEIRENTSVTKKLILRESIKIVRAHPTSLGCLMKDESDVVEAAEVLKNSIMGHIQYIQAEIKKRKSTRDSSDPSSKKPRFTKAQCYALCPQKDLPNDLPDGETPDTQEAKRVLMIQMFDSGECLNWTSIRKLMIETYCAQRFDIQKQLTMDIMLKRWPFIGKHIVLQSHFEFLMNLNVSDAVGVAATTFPAMQQFFHSETSKTRKGDSAAIPKKLNKILKDYQQAGDASPSSHLIAIVLCAMAFMKVETNLLFLCFEDTTSFDEIQASDRLPDNGKPIIAVLGNNLVLNPKAYVVIEKRCISDSQVSCAKAIGMLLMAYFVFKYEYCVDCAPILHFLQRKYFGIEINEGTRTERRKGKNGQYYSAAPVMPPQYLKLMKEFKEYCHKWGLEMS